MRTYLLFGGPMDGQYVTLPEGTGQLKISYDPQKVGLAQEDVKFRTGFYLYRTQSTLEWQPDPH